MRIYFAYMYVCAPCAFLTPVEREEGVRSSETEAKENCEPPRATLVLRTKPQFLQKSNKYLNCSAISPSPFWLLVRCLPLTPACLVPASSPITNKMCETGKPRMLMDLPFLTQLSIQVPLGSQLCWLLLLKPPSPPNTTQLPCPMGAFLQPISSPALWSLSWRWLDSLSQAAATSIHPLQGSLQTRIGLHAELLACTDLNNTMGHAGTLVPIYSVTYWLWHLWRQSSQEGRLKQNPRTRRVWDFRITGVY